MGLTFEALLVLATALTGLTVAFQMVRLRRRRKAGLDMPERENWWIDLCRSIFPVLLVVLIIRSFVVEPFRIPSGSMLPTLLPGDFILVSKASYGVRLPITNQRLFGGGEPQRGDLAVFKYPLNPQENYIKRIVGLPGDVISSRDGQLHVNGEPLPRNNERREMIPYMGNVNLMQETLGERQYDIVLSSGEACTRYSVRSDYEVPAGSYFAIGDNRGNSADSRCWGPVAEELMVGRAFFIWMSWDGQSNRINWERIGGRLE